MDYSLLYHHPVDFDQLKRQARELLGAYRAGDAEARSLFAEHHGRAPGAEAAKLADAQLALARAYDYPSWPRFKLAAELANAIRGDRAEDVLGLIGRHPKLLTENVFGAHSNWGPPLSVATQIDAPRVLEALLPLAGQDFDHAFGRAALQGRVANARLLLARGARLATDEIMGPCETLNAQGLRLLIECGAPFQDREGKQMGPVGLLLQGYHRDPEGKHACLAYCSEIGIEFPDTPAMAFHRGRIDLLEAQLAGDPDLPRRRFSHREIYPLEAGCHEDASLALHGTPLAGTTLLHMAMDFDEVEIARWLLDHGADPNARAALDGDGFGGHTPLFNLVVSQAYLCGRQRDDALARLLLDRGADPNAVASIRKGIRFVADESVHEYRDVTPLAYGRAFHERRWVNEPALKLIQERGGRWIDVLS